MARYDGWSSDRLLARIRDLEDKLRVENGHGIDSSSLSTTTSKPLVKGTRSEPKVKRVKTNARARPFEFDRYETRYVAFKFAYLGWNYNGLVTQDMPTELPTVEEEIFNALLKTHLISHPDECRFSRCGRTDKGVSAMGQVMALNVRSARLRGTAADAEIRELAWIDQINGCLPPSIRLLAYDDSISPEFDARFSCVKRHYKYLISPRIPGAKSLDVEAMRKAASYFCGEHDFRNFCKLDASKQINNFRRTILRCEINSLESPRTPFISSTNLGMLVLDLEGTAFLWHQVRCMTAILLLVGQGLESPEVVGQMLDVTKMPTKPIYDMADDWPLTLYDCDFGDQVRWKYSSHSQRVLESAFSQCHEARIKDTISSFLVNSTIQGVPQETMKAGINLGDGRVKVQAKYTPIIQRKRMADVVQLNAAYAEKKERKLAERQTVE